MKNFLMMIISTAITTHLTCIGVEAAEQKDVERYYHDEISHIGALPVLVSFDTAATSKAIEIRVRPEGRNRQSEWSIEWLGGCSAWTISVAPNLNSPTEDLKDEGFLITTSRDGEKIASKSLVNGISAGPGANSLLVEWQDTSTDIYFGSDRLQPVYTLTTSLPRSELLIKSNGSMAVEELITEEGKEARNKALTTWTEESISDRMIRAIKPEGIWEFLDRENDPKSARLGGRYSFALIRDNDTYLIIYCNGAEINRSQWRTGMLKGKLMPTKFKGQYNLLWYDSMFTDRGDEGYATIDEESQLLTIYFPILKATLRFTRK